MMTSFELNDYVYSVCRSVDYTNLPEITIIIIKNVKGEKGVDY